MDTNVSSARKKRSAVQWAFVSLMVLTRPPLWACSLSAELIRRRRLLVGDPAEWLLNAYIWIVSVASTVGLAYCLYGWLFAGMVTLPVVVIVLIVYLAIGVMELRGEN